MKKTSLTEWVLELSECPGLCAIAGFAREDAPSLGAYYAYMARLWPIKHRPRQVNKAGYPFGFNKSTKMKNLKKGDKLPESKEGITQRLYEDYYSQGKSLKKSPQYLMQSIFTVLAAIPSIMAGIVGEGSIGSGDSTAVACHSNIYGTKICECKERKCGCDRRGSDPDARVGYDSGEGTTFYGYSLYMLTARNPNTSNELPILLRLGEAQRSDAVMGLVSIDELFQHLPELKLGGMCLDSAHDNISTYMMLADKNVEAFIDLNPRSGEPVSGPPKCKAGLDMAYSGYEKKRNRHKWKCPFKEGASACPLGGPCTSSRLGAVRHTSPEDDLRAFPVTPRGSKKWKETYNNRSSSERMNKRFLHDYNLAGLRMRLQRRYAFAVMAIGINIHLDALLKLKAA